MTNLDNAVLEDIKQYAMKRLNTHYGFVGAALSPTMAQLNSTDNAGNDLVIKFEVKSNEEAVPA